MGNLDDALWIANPEYRAGGVSLFIRAFSVEEKPVRATLTITGLGWFASYLNGVRTDDEYFKPLLSDYGERSFEDVRFYRPKGGIKRVYYHTFDVAHLLRAGENRLSVRRRLVRSPGKTGGGEFRLRQTAPDLLAGV